VSNDGRRETYMRFLCPTCDQLSELSDARVEDGILFATCETCAAEARAYVSVSEPFLKSAANAQGLRTSGSRPLLTLVRNEPQGPREEFSIPPGCCPKCIAVRRPGANACSECGLVEGNFRAQSFELSPALKAS